MALSRIICIGSTSKDIFFPTDEGIIMETPEDITSQVKVAFEVGGKYRVADRYEALGGVAANVSLGLARQGYQVRSYTKVGKDDLGSWAKTVYEKGGVDTECLFEDPTVRTDLSAIIVLDPGGERTIFHNRDANEKLEIFEERLIATDWLFVSALNGPWEGNLKKILALKEKQGLRLAFNPGQHNIRENPALVREALKKAEIAVLNKDEALELLMPLSEREDFQDERRILNELRTEKQTIGLTDGKRGAWGMNEEAYWHCESSLAGKVIDATGAGDAFTSGFLGGLLSEASLDEAVKRGVANSLSVLQSYGGNEGLLTAEELAEKGSTLRAERLG